MRMTRLRCQDLLPVVRHMEPRKVLVRRVHSRSDDSLDEELPEDLGHMECQHLGLTVVIDVVDEALERSTGGLSWLALGSARSQSKKIRRTAAISG